MTKHEFDALIARLEIQVARDPAAYQRRVTLLALLGNVYLGALLLVIVAILIALAAYVMVLKAIRRETVSCRQRIPGHSVSRAVDSCLRTGRSRSASA